MKLHFEPDLDFQRQAIEAVCGLFRGQEVCRTEFTLTRRWKSMPDSRDQGSLNLGAFMGDQGELGLLENGIGNRLTLLDEEILQNLNAVQLRNGLPPSDALDSGDFTVEMETGTGAGKSVRSIGSGALIACLDENVAQEDIGPLAPGTAEWHTELAPASDSTVVFRDIAFADDVAKANLATILERRGLGNVRSL